MTFYKIIIDEGRRKKYSAGIMLDESKNKNIQCNSCGREWEKEALLDNEVFFNIALTNSNYPDFVYFLYYILVSNKVKDVFLSENIKGYHLEDINVVSKSSIAPSKIKELRDMGYKVNNIPNNPPSYYKLVANRSAGLCQHSNVVLEVNCDICGFEGYEVIGDIFQPKCIKKESWNGDDIFMVKEFCSVEYCSEKIVEVYKKHELTGLTFQKVDSL